MTDDITLAHRVNFTRVFFHEVSLSSRVQSAVFVRCRPTSYSYMESIPEIKQGSEQELKRTWFSKELYTLT